MTVTVAMTLTATRRREAPLFAPSSNRAAAAAVTFHFTHAKTHIEANAHPAPHAYFNTKMALEAFGELACGWVNTVMKVCTVACRAGTRNLARRDSDEKE